MVSGVCNLCAKESSLVNSHVFPEFFYERTYNEAHQFISVSNHPLRRPRPMQRGLTERLLCAGCDNQISKYATYAAALLRRIDATPETIPGQIVIEDVDLKTFRLFGLSLLWRAHVAKSYMFRSVRLGSHAERLRSMLRAGDPGDPHKYGFTFAKIVGLETHGHLMLAPIRTKYEGHPVYQVMARGYEWVFMVSNVSRDIRNIFPYVGFESALVIVTVTYDKRQLFRQLRQALAK
jgi:hypothetical protein